MDEAVTCHHVSNGDRMVANAVASVWSVEREGTCPLRRSVGWIECRRDRADGRATPLLKPKLVQLKGRLGSFECGGCICGLCEKTRLCAARQGANLEHFQRTGHLRLLWVRDLAISAFEMGPRCGLSAHH